MYRCLQRLPVAAMLAKYAARYVARYVAKYLDVT